MSEKRIDLFNLFKNEGKLSTLHVYQAREVVNDPYEKTKTLTNMNPLPIKGLIRQVSVEALHWKYYGQIPVGSIEVIAEKKYLTLFRTADRIKYNDNYYKCWKDDSQNFAIIERPDYVVVVLGLKND
jgi:hypothetical protein